MKNYLDTILVGVVTFIIVAVILIIKPGYTPIELSDEVLNPPAIEAVDEEAEVETEEAESADEEAETESEDSDS